MWLCFYASAGQPLPSSPRAASRCLSHLFSLSSPAAAGFANRLARRMPLHNGYRTLAGEKSALAQLHPSCARLDADADGLLPEWVVYHELVATGHVFLSKAGGGGEGA